MVGFSHQYYVVKLTDEKYQELYDNDYACYMKIVGDDIKKTCIGASIFGAPAWCKFHLEVWCKNKRDVVYLKTKYNVVDITEPCESNIYHEMNKALINK